MQSKEPELPTRTRTYVEMAFDAIAKKPNILDIVILNNFGNPVKSTMDSDKSVRFSGFYEELRGKLERGMAKIDKTDELKMLRVRTSAHEVLITPDGKITVIVVQNANDRHESDVFYAD